MMKEIMRREDIYKGIECHDGVDSELQPWKEFFYYGLYDLIKKDEIFSKLPRELKNRKNVNSIDNLSNILKNIFLIPIICCRKIFLISIERLYYKKNYNSISMLADLKTEVFDYLFVLNTKDHIIAALPVLESLDDRANSLVIIFKDIYNKYQDDFNNLNHTKVLFFEYELSNLTLKEYLRIVNESQNKFSLLECQSMDSDLKQLIIIDMNFIKFHLKTELIQYCFFKKIFNMFDLKGVVSIVFTTAIEIANEKKIPTFILQHGIGGKGHEQPFASDYIFTYDEKSKEQLDIWLDHTVDIIPIGSPRFEYLKNHLGSKKDITRFNKKIGKSGYEKTVTYIGGGTENQVVFQALKSLRKALPEYVNLIIKLHPRIPLNMLDIKMEMEKILIKKELNHTTFIRGEIDFYEILANSDVVITIASTGMLESIASDIPTIQVNFTSQPYSKVYDLSSYEWKEPINDPAIMVDEVLSIINDKKRYDEVIEKQRWLKNRMFMNFGSCGKIIAETIVNICNKSK